MKKITSIIFLLAFTTLYAQESLLNFQEENILINGVSVNVGKVLLTGDVNQVTKSWSSFVKKQIKEKVREDDGILTVKETVVNQITDKRGDLMTYIFNKDNSVSFNIAYKLGYDVYLNSGQYPEEFNRLKDFTNHFVYNYYNDFLPKHIKSKSKELKTLKKEVSKSEKTSKKATKQNKSLDKGNIKISKKLTKSDKELAVISEPVAKNKLLLKQNEYNKTIENNTKTIAYNQGLITTQESIIQTIAPKIDQLSKEINSLNLTLIEVKAKTKIYK